LHQLLIPAGAGDDLRSREIIGNLQFMFEHPDRGEGRPQRF
jgi:hypothetical protein